MQLIEACELFLGTYDNPNTTRDYTNIVVPFVNHVSQGMELEEVTPAHVVSYIQKLKSGKVRARNGDWINLQSYHSTYKHIKGIKRFFNWCVDMELLEQSPARKISNPNPKREVNKDKAATEDEIKDLLRAAYGNIRAYAITLFLVDTAARAIGVANLKIDDIDFDNLKAEVLEKFGKIRPVFFTEETSEALQRWLLQRPHVDHDYVFVGVKGDTKGLPMTSDAVRQVVYRLFKKLGITHGSHAIRHYVGFALADEGVSPTIAAQVLGHDDPQVTMDSYYPRDWERAENAIRNIHSQREDLLPRRKKTLKFRQQNNSQVVND